MVNSRIDPHNGIILCTDRPHLLSPLNKPKQAGILNIKGICPATQLSVSGLCSLLTYHTVVALTWTFQIQTTEFVLNSLSTVSIGCFCFNFRLFYFGLQSIAGIYVNCVVPMQSMRCFYYFPAAPRNEWSACPGPAAPRSRRAPCLENIYPKYRVGTIAAEWRSGHQDLAGPRDRVRPRNCLF